MSFTVGVQGYPLPSVSRLQPRDLARVAAAGAEAVGLYMTTREREEPHRWASRVAERLEAAGLRCVHLVGPAAQLLAHGEGERKRAVETVASGIAAAAAVGADGLFVQPGGFSDFGPWWWHPRNYETASRIALAKSLRELGKRAEAAGIRVVVEGAQTSVLESPQAIREVLERAGSHGAAANLDYVNFLTPPLVARFPEAFARMTEELGSWVASVHVKDAVVWPRLSGHVEEVHAGSGVLDLRPVVAYARAASVPALVEHLRAPHAHAAIGHLAALAAESA